MKSISYFFNQLEEPWKTQALKNCEKNPFNDVSDKQTAAEALRKAFYWAGTPEGKGYWETLYLSLI